MAFNGSGTFNRVHSWATDKTNAVPVTASRMDSEMDGMATGLSTCLLKDGQQTATARIPFALGVSTAAGSTSAAAYAQTNDLNTGLYFPAADQWGLSAGGTGILTGTSSGVTVAGTSALNGTVTITSAGGLRIVEAGTTVAMVVSASLLTIDENTSIEGTLAATGNFAINTNKFNVTAASGNTAIAGTLAVTGATTLSAALTVSAGGAAITGNSSVTGTLGASGNFAINTNKFTVTAASGNTAVAGTLGVTGAATFSAAVTIDGALTAGNALGVDARNTVKAFGRIVNTGLASGSFNIANVASTDGGTTMQITFTNAMADENYAVLLTVDGADAATDLIVSHFALTTSSFKVQAYDVVSAGGAQPDSFSFMVLSNE